MRIYRFFFGCMLFFTIGTHALDKEGSCELTLDFGQEDFSQEEAEIFEKEQLPQQSKVIQWISPYVGTLIVWYLKVMPKYRQYKQNLYKKVRQLLTCKYVKHEKKSS